MTKPRTSRLILPDEFYRHRGKVEIPDINKFIHQRIKIALQLTRIPWRVPVSHDPNCGLPCNVRTGGRYRGVNTLLLCDTYRTLGYHSKWWGTAEDWSAIGAAVKEDQEPTVIAQYRSDASLQVDPCLVYNAAQVHGADQYQAMTETTIVANDEADFGLMGMLIEHHAPDVRYDIGDHENPPDSNVYRSPWPWHDFPDHESGDVILMQSEKHFRFKSDFYSVLLHELMHWAEVRTGWHHCIPVREFVAETGMHVLGLELGVPYNFDETNHRIWMKHWNTIFNKDESFFFWAMAQVDRACDFLLQPILHREPSDYHDPCNILPEVHFISGSDEMSFEAAW